MKETSDEDEAVMSNYLANEYINVQLKQTKQTKTKAEVAAVPIRTTEEMQDKCAGFKKGSKVVPQPLLAPDNVLTEGTQHLANLRSSRNTCFKQLTLESTILPYALLSKQSPDIMDSRQLQDEIRKLQQLLVVNLSKMERRSQCSHQSRRTPQSYHHLHQKSSCNEHEPNSAGNEDRADQSQTPSNTIKLS